MNRQALLIGGFIVGVLLLIATGVVLLSGSHLFGRQMEAVIYFQDGVSGLYVGAPVTFRGVSVGQVESIGLEFDEATLSERLPVTVYLARDAVTVTHRDGPASPPSLEALVKRGLRAKLVVQSFVTGQRAVELNIYPSAPPVVTLSGRRPEIPAVANPLDVFLAQLSHVPIGKVVADVQAALESTETTMTSVHNAMTSMRATLDTTGREVAGVGAEARKAFAVARTSVGDLRSKSETALASITRLADTATGAATEVRPELLRAIGRARDAAEAANSAMRHLAAISGPDAPLRVDLESAMGDVARAARSLREWSALVDEQPNAVIFGRSNP